jgi:hypothetical protein
MSAQSEAVESGAPSAPISIHVLSDDVLLSCLRSIVHRYRPESDALMDEIELRFRNRHPGF